MRLLTFMRNDKIMYARYKDRVFITKSDNLSNKIINFVTRKSENFDRRLNIIKFQERKTNFIKSKIEENH
jgi:hypothetical protein